MLRDTQRVPESVDERGLSSVSQILSAHASRTPNAAAIADVGRVSLSYLRLYVHVEQVVKRLNAVGLGRGDRVAIVLPGGPEMAATALAVSSCATSAPLNPAYRTDEFDFYLSDLKAKALIVDADSRSPAIDVAGRLGIRVLRCAPLSEAEGDSLVLKGDDGASGVHAAGGARHGFAEPEDVALVLHTSGTTSRPKIVPLTHANICESARNIRSTLGLTAEDRCLNIMPLFHIHGLIGVLLSSLTAGASVACSPGLDVAMFFKWMDGVSPTWYSAVPTMHQTILMSAGRHQAIIARRPLRFIRSSSAALPAHVMADLEATFKAPVIEAYGMTEASHQMASNPLPPGRRKPGSVGLATGTEVAIMDVSGNLLAAGHRGEIVIRGTSVMGSYEDSQTTQAAFTNGWFRTGDQGFTDSDGYIFITGRLKEIINRGGEKISPREVDEALMDHPAIAQAVTFGAPHPLLGEEVAAAVVLRAGVTAAEAEIQKFAGEKLAAFKVPRRVVILPEIPKGPTGKLLRVGLAEKLGLTGSETNNHDRRSPFVEPRDRLERQLTEIWERVLSIKPVGIRDNFFDLGGYSLLTVGLIQEIEHAMGKSVPPSYLLQASTVEQLAQLLRQEDRLPFSSLVAIEPNGSNPPFFFIHAVSGNVLNGRQLSRYLGAGQPFYGLQAQGLDGRLPPLGRIEDMAALYIKEIQSVQPQGPYFLGGGSSGGVVAFEMAQQFRQQGERIGLLALFDTYYGGDASQGPAQAVSRSYDDSLARKVDRFVGNLLFRTYKERMTFLWGIVRKRLDSGVAGLPNNIHNRNQGPLARAMREVLKANRKAMATYAPKSYDGPMVLFLSNESPDRCFYDRRLGWSDVAAEGLEVHVVPGNHETLFAEPHVQMVAERLKSCFRRARMMSWILFIDWLPELSQVM